MPKNKLLALALVPVVTLLASCGASSDDAAPATTAPATTVPASTTEAPATTSAPTVTTTPKPNPAQAASLEGEIAAVYPGVPAGKAADWARGVCSDILGGKTGADLEGSIILRYEGGDRPSPTPDQARQILDIIKRNGFCPAA